MGFRPTIPRRYRVHVELLAAAVIIGGVVWSIWPTIQERADEERQRLFRLASLLVYQGDLEGLRSFLSERDAQDVVDVQGDGHTLLHVASGQRNLELMSLLLDVGLNANDLSRDGVSPLFFVFETHDPQYNPMGAGAATELLLERGADPNTVDAFGRTPLLSAVQNGEKEAAGLLIAAGANVNVQRDASPATPLLAAVAGSRLGLTQSLLAAGADPNISDWNGATVLHMAIRAKDVGMLEMLLNHGADPTLPVRGDYKTPLALAREIGCEACIATIEIVLQGDSL